MITRFTNLSDFPIQKMADVDVWRRYIKENLSKGIEIIIHLTNNSICIFCTELPKISFGVERLKQHYRYEHYYEVIDHILKNIIPIHPNQLQEMMNEDDA